MTEKTIGLSYEVAGHTIEHAVRCGRCGTIHQGSGNRPQKGCPCGELTVFMECFIGDHTLLAKLKHLEVTTDLLDKVNLRRIPNARND